jgi:site-specific DNA recombinase
MPASDSKEVRRPVRCAIYTRKSSEEGLDKEFNSLAAQREAAEAYIHSQRQEGWVALPETYDDGGFTGANMERPALHKLLGEIAAGRVDCVVVYKVDRLSRSLLDFARLMGEFEKHGSTFVSVTQQFNTSTPVGRLTLHILLSFAQFEREIISERTRDKKAAAKRKGKWTGGFLPLGYDLEAHGGRLVVNAEEAQRVSAIFELFAKLRSVDATVAEMQQRGWTTKSWMTAKEKPHAGTPFTATSLTRMLGNELYTGAVSYRGQLYRGEQPRIIAPRLWKRVHGILQKVRLVSVPKERNQNGALLQGLLHCFSCGKPMRHTSTAKGEHRYRYYVCRAGSGDCAGQAVSAPALEASVLEQLESLARQPAGKYVRKHLKRLGPQWRSSAPLDLLEAVRKVIAQVTYDATTCGVTIRLQTAQEKRHDADAP